MIYHRNSLFSRLAGKVAGLRQNRIDVNQIDRLFWINCPFYSHFFKRTDLMAAGLSDAGFSEKIHCLCIQKYLHCYFSFLIYDAFSACRFFGAHRSKGIRPAASPPTLSTIESVSSMSRCHTAGFGVQRDLTCLSLVRKTGLLSKIYHKSRNNATFSKAVSPVSRKYLCV